LKETKGKVPETETKNVQDALDALKKAQKDNNLDEMKAKRDDLNKIVQDLSVKMYEQAAKEQQAKGGDAADQATGDAKKDDDNTVDGDFEEVDPDKDKK
jgi:molecular chaperone DnaK